MKQSLYTLTAAIFLVLCTACTEVDTVLPVGGDDNGQGNTDTTDKGVPMVVNELGLSMEVASRAEGIVTGVPQTTTNNPNPITKVAVIVTKYMNDVRSFYDPDIGAKVFNYNEDTRAWEQDGSTPVFYLGTESGSVYQYAPVSLDPHVETVKGVYADGGEVKATQIFQFHDLGPVDPATDVPWDTDQEDFLMGKTGQNVNRWNPAVELELEHMLAKVSFRVMEANSGNYYAGSKIVKVELQSENRFCTLTNAGVNMNGGDLIGDKTYVSTLTFNASGGKERAIASGTAVAATVPVQAFGLVCPVGGGSSNPIQATLELTLDDGHVFTSPSFVVDWSGGINYIYTLTLSPVGLTISEPKVLGWDETVPAVDVPMDEPPG